MAQRSLVVKTERQKERKYNTDIKYCTCTESTAPKTNTKTDSNQVPMSDVHTCMYSNYPFLCLYLNFV